MRIVVIVAMVLNVSVGLVEAQPTATLEKILIERDGQRFESTMVSNSPDSPNTQQRCLGKGLYVVAVDKHGEGEASAEVLGGPPERVRIAIRAGTGQTGKVWQAFTTYSYRRDDGVIFDRECVTVTVRNGTLELYRLHVTW